MYTYKYFISLGFFCSPSMELDRIGLRDSSYPFDWLLSDIRGVVDCLEKDFDDFLEYENLYQYQTRKQYYFDEKYGFHFYHDFSAYQDLESQLPSVKLKYRRRIERFRRNIQEPTLFIRYIQDQDEVDYLERNYDRIISLLKSKNSANNLILISNNDVKSDKLDVYQVEEDQDDTVARIFLEKNSELKSLLCSDIYDPDKRIDNVGKYQQKQKKKKLLKYPTYASEKIRKVFKKPYIHSLVKQ